VRSVLLEHIIRISQPEEMIDFQNAYLESLEVFELVSIEEERRAASITLLMIMAFRCCSGTLRRTRDSDQSS
jgi:hypothetical protein